MTDNWRDLAACKVTNPDFFFPERGETLRLVKAVCHSCPVRIDCLEYALAAPEMVGVWGGLSERSRRQIRRDRRIANRRPIVRPTAQDNGCGTYNGYRAHLRRGDETCEECRRANNFRQRDEAAARAQAAQAS